MGSSLGVVVVVVRGPCMAPRYHDGERVEVAPARRYWPGDVIAFIGADGRLRLHRLLGYRALDGRLAFVTRGDGCDHHDSPVAPGRVLGRTLAAPSPFERARAIAALLSIVLARLFRRRSAAA
jgi:hypothetical protein